MFGMFPFMFNNMNNNMNSNMNNSYLNNSDTSLFGGLLNDDFLNNMVGQFLSSDLVSDLVNEIMDDDAYDVQLKDYGDYYLIKGYLPGLGPKDVSIDFEKNKAILTIKKKQTYSNGRNVVMTVIQTGGDLVKTFYVSEIDVTKLKATFDNSLLLLTLPKVKQVEEYRVEDTPTIIDVDSYKIE